MKLVTSLTSPYGRKARVVLLEKKIPFQLQAENPWLPDSPVSSINPLGKVPVLVLEDGVSVFDSRVIVEYLDHISPVAHLIPGEPRTRMVVRGIEALSDGVTDAAVAVFLERKRAPEQQSSDWLSLQQKTVLRGLEALSEALGDKPWYLGNSMTLADIACGCMLGYLELRFAEIDWRSAHPNLATLMDKLMARPSFRDTVPVV
ncbi:MAG TPA: glutathione S-transferase N-terminal domain-containing protein [Thiobacillus sp.]|nr:MAG: glutathione S-transferase [Hydrogenophilales bacterium 28-61-11]OYZ57880.1 MAG: glutathione S-transferase [Hydrogenophilales bacterium 16-61-112]OZA45240.1 MAG: glutathione S-transferase [Hydrogenophilales bacterium 17-61-76]HQT32113.1 glutathione S-transferase N-terminal domain-containing protein [Thiobacillus sp.]HQT69163.1 glutathione S-transferase N-terminal domain-containing protein [Thiobacillus sp.]